MKGLFKKLISYLFFKYVCEPLTEEENIGIHTFDIEGDSITKDFEIVLGHTDEFRDAADAYCYSLGGTDMFDLLSCRKKFKDEIDQAMYEKKFHTIH